MNVLHVIPAVGPHYGGPSVAIRGMTEALMRQGADVTVVTTPANGPVSLDVPLEVPVDTNGVTYWHFPFVRAREWKFSWPMTRWLYANVRRYDVVHVHAMFSYATIPGCRAAMRAQVPYVVRPLGTLSPWSLAHRAWKKRPYLELIERAHLAGAAAIHVTSESEGTELAALGFGERVRVIPLGVDVPVEPLVHRRRGGTLRVLFMARLHPKKNVPMLLEACAAALARAPGSVELVLAGDGESEYRRELQAHAHALALGGVVHFAGFVDGAEKDALLRGADVYVLPSSHENFGISAAEALAAGLPCIVSPAVALAPHIQEHVAGYVVPLSVEALAQALLAARDDERRERMALAARRLATEHFSWGSTAAKLMKMYEEISIPVNVRATIAMPEQAGAHS